MKPSDNEIEMLAAGFSIQHKNGLIRFAHALLEKYASARAIAFDDWLAKHCDSDDLTAYERELAWDAWNAALSAPQASEAVRDARTAGFLAGLDKVLEVLDHDDFATRAQSAQVIRAIKSQHATLDSPETRDG